MWQSSTIRTPSPITAPASMRVLSPISASFPITACGPTVTHLQQHGPFANHRRLVDLLALEFWPKQFRRPRKPQPRLLRLDHRDVRISRIRLRQSRLQHHRCRRALERRGRRSRILGKHQLRRRHALAPVHAGDLRLRSPCANFPPSCSINSPIVIVGTRDIPIPCSLFPIRYSLFF